jgi:lysophospholipase L1-like esterase
MKLSRLLRIALVPLVIAAHGMSLAAPTASTMPASWVGTWTAPPDSAGPALKPGTVRQIVRSSAGGSRVRIRLSNLFGSAPLTIDNAGIAVRSSGADIRAGSDHALTFKGSPAVTIAPGQAVLSDDIRMDVAPLQELAVSLYLPAGAARSTVHGVGMQTAYIAPGSDSSRAAVFPPASRDDSRYFLTDVEVAAEAGARAIAVVGDSIADGVGSTLDRNARWPDVLAEKLGQGSAHPPVAVLNAGIAGNRILNDAAEPFVGPSVLSRFERDALDKPGVRWIVLAQGINDITASDMLKDPAQHVSADQVIGGMRSLIQRAHGRGLKVWGATLLPLAGVEPPFIHSAEGEAKRQAINAWIRTSGEFDAVFDADQLMRDPAQPNRLLPRFDSGDHLHPNDAGYQVMAQAAAELWLQLESKQQARHR